MGLTESSFQLLRWMVSGPEIARLIAEFESMKDAIKTNQIKGPDVHHHEQVKGVQERFQIQVKALVEVMETLGNPFKEDSVDVLVLDTKEIANEQVVATVNEIEKAGQDQFQVFVEERLIKHKCGRVLFSRKSRLGVKSDLIKCLDSLTTNPSITPVVDAMLIDGAALVNMLKPSGVCKTFSDYANEVYLPYIGKHLQGVQRLISSGIDTLRTA